MSREPEAGLHQTPSTARPSGVNEGAHGPVLLRMVGEDSPFYRQVSFWLASLALLASSLALFVSYSSSPLSDIGRPIISYTSDSRIIRWPDRRNVGLLMTGYLVNETSKPATNVVATVFSIPSHQPKINIIVQSGVEYQILEHTDHVVTIKFPQFPPRFSCILIVDSQFDDPASLPHIQESELIQIVAAHHEAGIAQPKPRDWRVTR